MLTFFTDESSVNQNTFSIYGGVILSDKMFKDLTSFMYDLKRRYVLPQELELKWTFRQVFENMIRVGYVAQGTTQKSDPNLYNSLKTDYDKLKEEILDKVAATEVKMVIAVRPNQLLRIQDLKNVEYSIAAVARKFEKILAIENKLGLILADELPKRVASSEVVNYQYIIDLCCNGSNSVSFDRLISIVPTMNSHVSAIHQMNDILLGAIQFYILQFLRGARGSGFNLAKGLLGKIVSKFYRSPSGAYTINHGIIFYPPKNTRRNTAAGKVLDRLETQMEADFGII